MLLARVRRSAAIHPKPRCVPGTPLAVAPSGAARFGARNRADPADRAGRPAERVPTHGGAPPPAASWRRLPPGAAAQASALFA
jgi:hypothetical protein